MSGCRHACTFSDAEHLYSGTRGAHGRTKQEDHCRCTMTCMQGQVRLRADACTRSGTCTVAQPGNALLRAAQYLHNVGVHYGVANGGFYQRVHEEPAGPGRRPSGSTNNAKLTSCATHSGSETADVEDRGRQCCALSATSAGWRRPQPTSTSESSSRAKNRAWTSAATRRTQQTHPGYSLRRHGGCP